MSLVVAIVSLGLALAGPLHFSLEQHTICPKDGHVLHSVTLPSLGGVPHGAHRGAGAPASSPSHEHNGSACPWATLLHGSDGPPAPLVVAAPVLALDKLPPTITVRSTEQQLEIVHIAPSHSPPVIPFA